MSTTEIKSQILELLHEAVDESTLTKVLRILSKSEKKEETVWWETLSSSTQKSIEKGLEDANNGNFVSHSEVQSKANKLLGRA